MDSVYKTVKEEMPDFNFLKQGSIPRYKLLETFKENIDSVLLGTNTFWQGVDVPGEALQCVILTKIPFAVPTEPIIEARIEKIQREGKDPFTTYQIPQAAIMFKQGFGRLIRNKKDRGIIAILDPRVKTRGYGKTFLSTLPKCQEVKDIKSMKPFL